MNKINNNMDEKQEINYNVIDDYDNIIRESKIKDWQKQKEYKEQYGGSVSPAQEWDILLAFNALQHYRGTANKTTRACMRKRKSKI